jgi:phosphoribosyl-dephospho-CoA transferase
MQSLRVAMFARHDLVWLSDHGWQAALNSAAPHCRYAIKLWQQAEWPAIVRRADTGTLDDEVCLGIALPPDPADGSKKRIPLRAPVSDITKTTSPLCIDAAIAAAPAAWRAGLAALQQQAQKRDLSLRIYGSLALQTLTKQRYITAASDIDLLLIPATSGQLFAGLDLLASHAAVLPLDGEIVFPSGQAVAWKEWRNATSASSDMRVLVKGKQSVSLQNTAALLSTLADHSCVI